MKGEQNKMTEESINLETPVVKQATDIKQGLMSKFNNTNVFGIDTSNYKYTNLNTLFNTDPNAKHKVLGLFVNTKGKYGAEPNAIIENNLIVNLPRHLLETVNELLDDDRYIDYIKAGHVGFSIYQYHSTKYNRDAYSVTWLDL